MLLTIYDVVSSSPALSYVCQFDNLIIMDGNGRDKGLYWVYHFGWWTGYDVTPEEWDDLIFKHSLGSLKDQQESAEEIARRKIKAA